jgi:hypothetical protein
MKDEDGELKMENGKALGGAGSILNPPSSIFADKK